MNLNAQQFGREAMISQYGSGSLSKGVFVISIDFELIWGTIDKPKWTRFRPLCQIERDTVIDRLLALFHEFEFPATWCTVGHLFLDRCYSTCLQRHPEITRRFDSLEEERFDRDPCGSERSHGIFYGRQLIERILQCPTPQEIGSHSFSHVLFNESTCPQSTAESEIAECVRLARQFGLTLRSFAFPRNQVGHLDLLAKYGFTSFRGKDEVWFEQTERRTWIHQAGHYADVLLASEPPAVLPRWNANGLWEIPGSMLYTPSYGVRGNIPVGLRVSRARKGLERAARERKVFHLWFHPTDLVLRMDDMFDGLRRILDLAVRLREQGVLEIRSMASTVEAAESCGLGPRMAVGR